MKQVEGVLAGVLAAIAGGFLGVVGGFLYKQAGWFITGGMPVWGGWPFTDLTMQEAHAWQLGALVFMVVGGIICIIGMAVALSDVLRR